MAQRKVTFAENENYHIYSRGVERRTIFLSAEDYDRFIKLLYICNSKKPIEIRTIPPEQIFSSERGETLVDIGAYCLMTNHFHLLLHEKLEGGISRFMQKLLTAYSMYFNKKHNRTGSLFEGVFKSSHADSDRYLRHLYAYIHLNPLSIIEAGWKEKKVENVPKAKKFLREYPYSSYQEYTEATPPYEKIINPQAFPEYFQSPTEFEELVQDWLDPVEIIEI